MVAAGLARPPFNGSEGGGLCSTGFSGSVLEPPAFESEGGAVCSTGLGGSVLFWSGGRMSGGGEEKWPI